MNLFSEILIILFPLFTIVMIAYGYARLRPLDMTLPNQLNMEVFIPALLFSILSDQNFQPTHYQQLAIVWISIILITGLLSTPLAYGLKIPLRTLLPSMMFSNTGNMGIPLALFAFDEQALPIAVLLFVLASSLHLTLGIYIVSTRPSWWQIMRNPVIVATILGLGFNLLGWELPEFVLKPIEMLGQVAIPLMLFALGVRLTEVDLAYWQIGLLGAVWGPLASVCSYLLLSPWLTLPTLQNQVLILYIALPPAVLNFIIAEKFAQQPAKVAAMVMIGNVFSLITMPIALWFALRL